MPKLPTNGPIRPATFRGHEPNDYNWNGESFWLSYKGQNVYVRVENGGVLVETSRRGRAAEEPHDQALVTLPKGS